MLEEIKSCVYSGMLQKEKKLLCSEKKREI